ncbi:hypothetical protein FACS1894217_08740 [Clostridia bacterium]|nr:hypothetical protein FACS1894217_08740 [Clostridia bacterium]
MFILNPVSFRGHAAIEDFIAKTRGVLQASGDESGHLHLSRFPRDAIGVIRAQAARHADKILRVYSVGGDGTLFDCLNGVVGLDNAELVVAPGAEVRDLPALIKAVTAPADVIRCNGNYALSSFAVGAEAAAIARGRRVNAATKRRMQDLSYRLASSVTRLDKHLRSQRYNITVDGDTINGTHADLKAILGTLRHKQLHLTSDEPILVSLDGEIFYESKLTVQIVPDAVNLAALKENDNEK